MKSDFTAEPALSISEGTRRAQRRIYVFLCVLCVLCGSVQASESEDDDFLRLSPAVITFEGEAGLFLDAEDAEKISRWKEVLRLTQEERALLQDRIALEQEALKDCEEAARACETEKKRLKVKVKKARTGAGFLGVLLILALL